MYDWHLSTLPQKQLDGAARPMPQGKVLGGGSILNAMCWNRGGQDDYDAWEALGNPGWNWEGMLPYFKKVRGGLATSKCRFDLIERRVRHTRQYTPRRLPLNTLSIIIPLCMAHPDPFKSAIRNTSTHNLVSTLYRGRELSDFWG